MKTSCARWLLVPLLVLASAGSGCVGDNRPGSFKAAAGPVPSSDAATVHGAVLLALKAAWFEDGDGSPGFVVGRTSIVEEFTYEDTLAPPQSAGHTYAEETAEAVFRHVENLRPETWRSFLRGNAEPRDLSKVIRFSGPMLFLGERYLTEAHPGVDTLLSLSMPGVSADGRQALLYAELHRGGGDASGHYFLLVRDGSTWRVAHQVEIWIS
jgi:hypothetical protein